MLQDLILFDAVSSLVGRTKKRKRKRKKRKWLGAFFPEPEPDAPCRLGAAHVGRLLVEFSRLLRANKG
jgi:hypothetical protein